MKSLLLIVLSFLIFSTEMFGGAENATMIISNPTPITLTQAMQNALEGTLEVTIALADEPDETYINETEMEEEALKIKITVGDTELIATMEDNATTRAIIEQMPMTLPMSDLYGREYADDTITQNIPDFNGGTEPATRAQAAAAFSRLHEMSGEISAEQPNETQANETQALRRMKITVGDTVIYATLANNPTADAIAQRLPLTLNMLDLYGREMCYRFDDELPTDDVQTRNFQLGEIIYWPPRHSFVIMYHQDGEVFSMQHVGNLENPEDVSLFGQGNVTVTYELVD